MTTDHEMRAKLRKIEALFAGAATVGERAAAGAAADRIRRRLEGAAEDTADFKFTLPDPWSRHLFVALCRRYGLRPFRHPRMHNQTLVIRASAGFVDKILWPQFAALNETLVSCLAEVTAQVIHDEVAGHWDGASDPEEEVVERLAAG